MAKTQSNQVQIFNFTEMPSRYTINLSPTYLEIGIIVTHLHASTFQGGQMIGYRLWLICNVPSNSGLVQELNPVATA